MIVSCWVCVYGRGVGGEEWDVIFASCREFNSGDSEEGINGRAPKGACGWLLLSLLLPMLLLVPIVAVCQVVMSKETRSWSYPDNEDWTCLKEPNTLISSK